jgi:hypothetical protein
LIRFVAIGSTRSKVDCAAGGHAVVFGWFDVDGGSLDLVGFEWRLDAFAEAADQIVFFDGRQVDERRATGLEDDDAAAGVRSEPKRRLGKRVLALQPLDVDAFAQMQRANGEAFGGHARSLAIGHDRCAPVLGEQIVSV